LHHFALLQGPVQSAPAVQAGFAATFCFFAAKAGCAAANATMAVASESVAICLVMDRLPPDRSIRFRKDRMTKLSPQAAGGTQRYWITAGSNGGRDRDRTCDPLHVKEVLSR
jgi:hypothetical protein